MEGKFLFVCFFSFLLLQVQPVFEVLKLDLSFFVYSLDKHTQILVLKNRLKRYFINELVLAVLELVDSALEVGVFAFELLIFLLQLVDCVLKLLCDGTDGVDRDLLTMREIGYIFTEAVGVSRLIEIRSVSREKHENLINDFLRD